MMLMRFRIPILQLALLGMSALAWAADPPAATVPQSEGASQSAGASRPAPSAASAARISGTLKSSNKITRILAVDRTWADVLKTSESAPKDPFIYEAGYDATTGQFHIDKLLPGRTYDLIVWTTDARGQQTRWEGANMDYHRPILPAAAATAEDRKSIEALITDPPQFYDKARVLRIAADHQHATVLVELMRTRDFHSDAGGEIIYRVELCYYENLFGGWAKDSNTEKVLARLRGKPDAFPQNWQFVPQLGGLSPGAEPLRLELPDAADPKHGIAGGIAK